MISDIATENNLCIIADEVYRVFAYECEYTSLDNIDRVKDRVIIVDSVSKRYSACGAIIGSVSSKNKDYIASMLKLFQARLSVPTLEQVGAIGCSSFKRRIRGLFKIKQIKIYYLLI